MPQIPVLTITAGCSNNGKTTVLASLATLLNQRLRLGLVKHSHHALEFNGKKDSDILWNTGVQHFVMATPYETLTCRKQEAVPDLEQIVATMDSVDLILVEGYKDSNYPKIEVLRSEVATSLYCAPQLLVAVVTDLPQAVPAGIPVFALDEQQELANFIYHWYLKEVNHE